MSEPTLVVFNGIRFRRYPDAKQRTDRVYFTPGIADKQRGIGRLHEEIWKAERGPIPADHHIHHADLDPFNNEPSNLECLTVSEHRRRHLDEEPELLAKLQANAAIGRSFAAAWHSTPEGTAWHAEHGRLVMDARPMLTAQCEKCGSEYESKGPMRFCSNKCKTAARYASGVDNEKRTCEWCSVGFIVNKYTRRRFCSLSCAAKKQHSKT